MGDTRHARRGHLPIREQGTRRMIKQAQLRKEQFISHEHKHEMNSYINEFNRGRG